MVKDEAAGPTFMQTGLLGRPGEQAAHQQDWGAPTATSGVPRDIPNRFYCLFQSEAPAMLAGPQAVTEVQETLPRLPPVSLGHRR